MSILDLKIHNDGEIAKSVFQWEETVGKTFPR